MPQSPIQEKDSTQPVTDEAVRAINHALRDFGYPVDNAYCRKAVDELMAGEAAKGGPQMFIETWLRDAKLLPEAKS